MGKRERLMQILAARAGGGRVAPQAIPRKGSDRPAQPFPRKGNAAAPAADFVRKGGGPGASMPGAADMGTVSPVSGTGMPTADDVPNEIKRQTLIEMLEQGDDASAVGMPGAPGAPGEMPAEMTMPKAFQPPSGGRRRRSSML